MFHLAHQVTTITEITSSPCILANSCLRKQKNYSWGRCDINALQPALTLLQNKLESSALRQQMVMVVPLLPTVAAKNSAAPVQNKTKQKNKIKCRYNHFRQMCILQVATPLLQSVGEGLQPLRVSPSSITHSSICPMYLWHGPIKNIPQLLF